MKNYFATLHYICSQGRFETAGFSFFAHVSLLSLPCYCKPWLRNACALPTTWQVSTLKLGSGRPIFIAHVIDTQLGLEIKLRGCIMYGVMLEQFLLKLAG